ncbi:MAG: tetratricopeptide repeat protein, partial [Actinomycetota bacterium]
MTTSTDTYSSLTASPRVEDLRDRHLEYYADLAERGDAELYGPDVAAWHRLLDSEFDNVTQALERAVETGQELAALRLANIIYWVTSWRGDSTAAGPWLEKALAVGSTASGPRAQALLDLGAVASGDLDDRQRGYQLAQEALLVAREAGDKKFEAYALRRLGGQYAHEVGGPEAATGILEQSLEVARQTGNEHEVAHSLYLLAWRKWREDPEGFRRDYQTTLDIYRRVGDIWSAGWIVYGMAWGEPDPIKAQDLAEEALKIARELEDQVMIICVLDMMGWLAHGRGEYSTALETFETTLEEFRRPGRKWPLWWAVTWQLASASSIEVLKGELEKAKARDEESLQIASEHQSKSNIYMAKTHLGRIAAFQGDHEKGLALAEEAVAIARDLGQRGGLGFALSVLGEVALFAKDMPRARSAHEEALSIRRDEQGFQAVTSLMGVAAVAIADERWDDARTYLDEALVLSRKSPWVSSVQVTQTALAKVERLRGN